MFVSFDDAVFFDGESYALRQDGEQVLADVSDIFSKAAPYIDEVRVMGHTAQASPDQPNRTFRDRFLSSNRATIAAVYIQEHSALDPARIVSVGFGQHRPVAPNDSEENRSHNRRVEIELTGRNVLSDLGDSVQKYYTQRQGSESDGTEATVPVEQAGRETE